ncbi:MAG: DUF1080 domain-containing protein [Pirellulales bacterium]
MRYFVRSFVFVLSVATLVAAASAQEKGKAYTDPAKVDEDFALQGEYSGEVKTQDGDLKVGAQVIALGDGKFRMVGFHGGLPGDGWDGSDRREADGARKGDRAVFEFDENTVVIEDKKIVVTDGSGSRRGELKKLERKSPTLGKKPPEGAIVLFDGKSTNSWQKARMTDNGLLMQGVTSKQKFGSHSLHIEFRLPYQPAARGQQRGNSGSYLQGRYEVQMLDSFGLEGKNNECGGIYTIAEPKVNMCYPPLTWQTYDIDYTAAEYDGAKKTKNARVTVKHNGVTIHDNVELTHATTAAPLKEGPEPGPVYLQDHGNPVRFRNIWVVVKK